MVICVIGPPSAGKTTYIKSVNENFRKIISDEIFEKLQDWELVESEIRQEILQTYDDIIVEIDPLSILDLVDFIVEIKPPKEPRRKLDQDEEELFNYWHLPNYLQTKVKIKSKNLKWEMLNKVFSKQYATPFKWR